MKTITNINTMLDSGLTQGRNPINSVSLFCPREALLELASDGTETYVANIGGVGCPEASLHGDP